MSTTVPVSATARRRQNRDRFVAEITALCADKGTRADLRSGLGRPLERCGRMHRYLSWRVPQDSFGERAHYAVASLIADQPRKVREAQAAAAAHSDGPADDALAGGRRPDSGPDHDTPATAPAPGASAWNQRPNLGTSLALAVRAGMKEDSAESHLRLLTRQSFASIHPRLPSLLQYVQDKGAAVDWAVLLDDLAAWDADRDRVATRWLQAFYRTLHAPRQPTDPTAPDAGTEGSESR